ncbi:MAG: sugar phosphate isomerase/epimerase [Acidobacteriia bacterium]|nr:sugar phosphate isomerase/epimerase [Terriglobia bacterium]
MQRVLSTYLFVNRKLTAALVREVARAEVSAIELFCSRGHFDYRSADDARELASWLAGNNFTLHSIHSPTTRDFHPTRESGTPLSIADPERVRRQEAVDEMKRALDLAEYIPFRYCIQHVARSRDIPDQRRWDAAFSSLEHLSLFAKQRGVTLALENTLGEMATPANLKHFLEQTRLTNVKLCFDIGHAHIAGGVPSAIGIIRNLVVTTHVHDNNGERDDHLLPYDGTVDWNAMLASLPPEAPIVLELKEPAAAAGSSELQAFAETLQRARSVFEKFEQALAKA